MSKALLVARHEFMVNIRRKSYLFAAFGVPLFIGALMFFVIYFIGDSATSLDDYNTVGIVDNAQITTDLTVPDDLELNYVSYPDEDSATQAYLDGDIQAILVLNADYLLGGDAFLRTERTASEALLDEIDSYLVAATVTQTADGVPLERLQDPLDAQIQFLGSDDITPIESALVRFILPMVIGFLIMLNILTTSQFLMSGVSEEKENAIMEILITSLRPIHLLAGKVIGLGGLALIQVGYLFLIGLIGGAASGQLDILVDAQFEPFMLLMGLLYFFLEFLLFAAIMIGVGAVTNAEQEARQFAGIFVLLAILPPSYGFIFFVNDPDGIIVLIMSLFPLTSPMSMMILFGLGEVAAWRIIASLSILLVTVIATTWFSARIFRIAMLTRGQRINLKQLRFLLKEN